MSNEANRSSEDSIVYLPSTDAPLPLKEPEYVYSNDGEQTSKFANGNTKFDLNWWRFPLSLVVSCIGKRY